MTISISSVINEAEQDKIIEEVKRIFDEINPNQVKIEFYGVDNWEEKPFFESEILHFKSGRGELLREVYLNC